VKAARGLGVTAALGLGLAAGAIATVATPPIAAADPAGDVAGWIKLIQDQPADLDRTAWKEKRRDAARKLAGSRDKRAVPVLTALAESETFDIIGEIAIEGLGALGDRGAVPTLQKIAADPARDKDQRDLARRALTRLGAKEAAPTTKPVEPKVVEPRVVEPTPTTEPGPAEPATMASPPTGDRGGPSNAAPTSASISPALLGGGTAGPELPDGPSLPDDTIAASERFTFALGSADLGYDTIRDRPSFHGDVAASYARRLDRAQSAWGLTGDAHLVTAYVNPSGNAVSQGAELVANVAADARFYGGPALYGFGAASGALQVTYVSNVPADPANPSVKEAHTAADLQVELGGGYGRVVDVGAAVRVRRLARALEAGRALGKPIDAALARRLQLAWWALRGERTTYRALVVTVALLRQAGVLLGEPDAGLAYELLAVLRDSQLYLRPSGLDVQLGVSEGYLRRPNGPANAPIERGRVEQLLLAASYGRQLADDTLELAGGAFGRLRLLAPDGQPSPWAAGVNARLRRFTYGEHGDPLGAIDATVALSASKDDVMGTNLGQRLEAQLGYTWWVGQASGFRLAANVAEDSGELFLGAALQLTYGLLDGTMSR
jgi:hypothetical protein